ncbi:tyrosine-type recombinase/integrase [Acidithiobacillus caldus]|uniref:Integrase n=1 Tax=Acidithiobacillus caldus (strain SM-1) TaxID=990288 RepID=F9ZQN0_ACICS|nr:site-specific integrase [Acidithiobacillus caldus]AEK58630.1 integrase [Acidithiobacillus caldus SM-1]AUW33187.1 tyrosine-type recombinase/integrase [Acidithiobacillus caldus]MBU2801529.1 tyrosine-type recombinase/integrase [Acidithiobacillus caldus]QER45040.1 phage integrase family protein [Acidithiobacillus caldus]
MPEKINFTKTALLGLEPLPGKRRRVYDEKQKGLVVYVSPTGSKVFYCLKKVDGKVEEIRIGDVTTVTIETARAQAAKIINDIAAGANPAEQRRRKRAEMTFAQLFAEWTKEARARGKRSVANDERNYRLHLQGLAKRKLSEIQRQHVRALHQKIGKDSGIYAANRVLALVRAVFNFGIKELDLSLSNPAAGIKMHREESRDRRLHADELPRFFEALAEEENVDIRDYVLLSLLTGGRRSNVLSMRWDEINLERGIWRIPSSKAKAGEVIEVPLSAAAQEILKDRASANGKKGFVFPGPGRAGHLVEPRKGWERILKRAGIEDLRLHDLRRSLASFQIDAGVSLAVIGKGLGHQNQATTAVYARLAQEPVRDAMEKGAAAILAAAGVTNPAKVVPIRKGKRSA